MSTGRNFRRLDHLKLAPRRYDPLPSHEPVTRAATQGSLGPPAKVVVPELRALIDAAVQTKKAQLS